MQHHWGGEVSSANPQCALSQGLGGGEVILATGSNLWSVLLLSLKIWPSTIAFLS